MQPGLYRAIPWVPSPNRGFQMAAASRNLRFLRSWANGFWIAKSLPGDFIDMSKLILKITVGLAFIVGGLVLSSPSSFGKTEYTKKEGKGCTYCHTAAGKKDLNDLGKCYAEHNHTLEGCAK